MDISSNLPLNAGNGLAQAKSQKAANGLANAGAAGANDAAIAEAAKQFEASFLSQMFSHMFESVETDQLFGGGHGEEMFRSMLVDEYSKQVVKHGGIGVAENVMRTMIAQQESQS